MFFSVTLILFGFVFQYGNAASECPVPGVTSLIYFDLEQLSLVALQQGFNNVIQSPQLCPSGIDEECSKQTCCHGEVGCCYTKSAPKSRKCGCKRREDETCSYPAPLAIMANTECLADKQRKISTCWRENRGNEENHILITNGTMQSFGTKTNRGPIITEAFVRFIVSTTLCDALVSGDACC